MNFSLIQFFWVSASPKLFPNFPKKESIISIERGWCENYFEEERMSERGSDRERMVERERERELELD